jgi:hypothetical protein
MSPEQLRAAAPAFLDQKGLRELTEAERARFEPGQK